MGIPLIGAALRFGGKALKGIAGVGAGVAAGVASQAGNAVAGQVKKAFVGSWSPRRRQGQEHHPGYIKRILDAGWQIDALSGWLGSMFPSAAVSVEVDVFGGPESNKQDVYYLALAIAFGTLDYKILSSADSTIEAMIDHTGRHCRVKYTQMYSGTNNNLVAATEPQSGVATMFRPVQQDIYAGKWPALLQTDNQSIQQQLNSALPKGNMIAMLPKYRQNLVAPLLPSRNYTPPFGNGMSGADFSLFTAQVPAEVCEEADTLEKAIARRLKLGGQPKRS